MIILKEKRRQNLYDAKQKGVEIFHRKRGLKLAAKIHQDQEKKQSEFPWKHKSCFQAHPLVSVQTLYCNVMTNSSECCTVCSMRLLQFRLMMYICVCVCVCV